MSTDWQEEHFSQRRIGHGKKSKGSTKGRAFDPRRCYGVYQLQCPGVASNSSASGSSQGTLEIHGPVEDHEDALMCTLNLAGVIEGVAILAGSRKVLQRVVRDVEEEEEDEAEESDEEDESDGDGSPEASPTSPRRAFPKTSIELADERERRRFEAFEKNSFRMPKFWMRWRAIVSANPATAKSGKTVEIDGGYLVFNGVDCASFKGTMSCKALRLKDTKLTGTRVVSKTTESKLGWLDVALDDEK